MSRSPIPCPRCGAVLADRRGKGTVAIRDDVEIVRVKNRPHTLKVTCPECKRTVDWLKVRLVVFELMAS